MYPMKFPTPGERAVIFWSIFVVFVGFGAVCLFFGYRAPAEKVEDAAKLIRGGYGFIAVSVAMYVIRRLFSG